MDKELIRTLALNCGFNLEPQQSGELDLQKSIYDFAEQLLAAQWIEITKPSILKEQIEVYENFARQKLGTNDSDMSAEMLENNLAFEKFCTEEFGADVYNGDFLINEKGKYQNLKMEKMWGFWEEGNRDPIVLKNKFRELHIKLKPILVF